MNRIIYNFSNSDFITSTFYLPN